MTDSEAALVAAVRAIDPHRVRALLATDAEARAAVNAPLLDFGSPPVVWAASARSRELLQALVEGGADIDARSAWDNGPYTALHHATGGSGTVLPDLAEFILGLGATLDLHSAAGLARVERLTRMLDAAPERLTERGPDGATPLHMAGTPEVADLLLDRGAPIDHPCVDHRSTPAMWAVDGRREVTRRLVERGCRTDLWMAAALGDVALTRRLLEADAGAITVQPGDEALGGGNIYIWRLHFASSPLEVARRDGFDEVYRLLEAAAPPELLLVEAAARGQMDRFDEILRATEVGELPTTRVRQLLCMDLHVARRMLAAGADPNAVNRHGQTALHEAAWNDDVERIDLLLDAGADPAPVDGLHGSTPWGWAEYNYAHAARARLTERGAYGPGDPVER